MAALEAFDSGDYLLALDGFSKIADSSKVRFIRMRFARCVGSDHSSTKMEVLCRLRSSSTWLPSTRPLASTRSPSTYSGLRLGWTNTSRSLTCVRRQWSTLYDAVWLIMPW